MKIGKRTTSFEKVKKLIEEEKSQGYLLKVIPDPYENIHDKEFELQFLFLNKNHDPVSKRYFARKLTSNITTDLYRLADITGKKTEW